jgi:hypothetical protein
MGRFNFHRHQRASRHRSSRNLPFPALTECHQELQRLRSGQQQLLARWCTFFVHLASFSSSGLRQARPLELWRGTRDVPGRVLESLVLHLLDRPCLIFGYYPFLLWWRAASFLGSSRLHRVVLTNYLFGDIPNCDISATQWDEPFPSHMFEFLQVDLKNKLNVKNVSAVFVKLRNAFGSGHRFEDDLLQFLFAKFAIEPTDSTRLVQPDQGGRPYIVFRLKRVIRQYMRRSAQLYYKYLAGRRCLGCRQYFSPTSKFSGPEANVLVLPCCYQIYCYPSCVKKNYTMTRPVWLIVVPVVLPCAFIGDFRPSGWALRTLLSSAGEIACVAHDRNLLVVMSNGRKPVISLAYFFLLKFGLDVLVMYIYYIWKLLNCKTNLYTNDDYVRSQSIYMN